MTFPHTCNVHDLFFSEAIALCNRPYLSLLELEVIEGLIDGAFIGEALIDSLSRQ